MQRAVCFCVMCVQRRRRHSTLIFLVRLLCVLLLARRFAESAWWKFSPDDGALRACISAAVVSDAVIMRAESELLSCGGGAQPFLLLNLSENLHPLKFQPHHQLPRRLHIPASSSFLSYTQHPCARSRERKRGAVSSYYAEQGKTLMRR